MELIISHTMNALRQAFRQLWNNPGFAAVVILTLALGIGANTAAFSVVNGVLLKPLPYPDPDRLVTLWERNPQRRPDQDLVSGPDYLDWKDQNTVFTSMAVSPGWQGSGEFNLVQRDGIARIRAAYASASHFPTLGVAPLLGRTFLPEDDQKSGVPVAVLSHGLWRSRFGGDPGILGQSLTLDTYGRRTYVIVGVMPEGFGVPGRSELWLPLGWMGVTLDERRSAHWHHVTARLKPGVTLDQARAEMNAIQARIAQAHPGELIGTEVVMVPLLEQALGRNLHRALWVAWGVVGCVLLIACANVANLLLARAADRQKEIALRLALGAGRGHLIRLVLGESLLLALLGGGMGTLLAWGGLYLVRVASPGYIPRLEDVTLDGAALLFTLVASMLTGILFGLAPAWQFTRPNLDEILKGGSRGASAGPASGRLRQGLIVAEVALSLVLLIGAGLMLRSFAALLFLDRGFAPEHLLTAELDYSVSGFTTWVRPTSTRPQVTQRELLERLRQRPGVVSAAVTGNLPRNGSGPARDPILIQDRPAGTLDQLPRTRFQAVSPDYFRTLGVPLLRGRDFTEGDHYEAPRVVLINESMARRYFPNQDPVGKRLAMPDRNNPSQPSPAWTAGQSPWSEIVGVVADMKSLSLDPEPFPQTYVPYWQWPMQSPTLLVRTTGDPAALAAVVRDEIKAVVPSLPSSRIQTMDDILSDTLAQPRFQAGLLGLFGVVALLLTAVGLYGVLACTVARRTREIGIRMAVGAQRGSVLALILGQGMRLALMGAVIGVVLALALTRILGSLLYEVKATDPLTFTGVTLLLMATAVLACWVPARRATRVDPMVALRSE